MMPNKTYELGNLYFQQSQYSTKQAQPQYPLLLQWPEKAYLESFKPDAELLQKAISPMETTSDYSLAYQVFGNQKQFEYVSLKHLANLFYERSKLHKQHIGDIDHKHIQIQEDLFGVKINNFPDRTRRLSGLEAQLLQLEQERRQEELAFWKDTAELREKMFASAALYKAAKHRYSVFSQVEGNYGRA